MMAAILNSSLSNLAILDSAILVFPFKLTHTCQEWFPSFAQKNFIHTFWLHLMMAAILNSAILDSAILVFPLILTHTCQDWFPQFGHKKLHSFILTQLVDGSHLEFCLCWIQTLPSWIQISCYLLSDSLKNTLIPLWLWLKLIQSD